MKNLILVASCALAACTAVSVFADDIDFAKVNPPMQALVDAVIAADENVDFAYPRFDENFCDLQAEKIKYDLVGSIKSTPWVTGGHADVRGSSTYIVDSSAGHLGVAVTLNATASTDVLALIRYSAQIALKRRVHTNPKFDQRIDAHLDRMAVAQSLDGVYDLLASANQLALEMVADEVTKAQTRLACVKAGNCGNPSEPYYPQEIQYAQDDVANWTRMQANISALQLKHFKDTAGVDTLTASSSSIYQMFQWPSGPLYPGKTSVTFTPNSVSLSSESFYALTQPSLDQLRTDFKTKLAGVQAGDQASKDYVQEQYRFALVEFKKTIRGEIGK